MKYLFVALLPFLMNSCASMYPLAGSVVGAGGGAVVGGVPGAVVGAGTGWGAGKAFQVVKEAKDENRDLTAQVDALTEGDVDKFIELKLKEKKESGFFDSILESVYDFIKLALLILVLWNVLPLVYTFISNKKINKKLNGGENGKNTSDT